LIQDTAYQSLLKSTRQQYHTQIAQVLEERFPDTKANQPELLAHHLTEAGQIGQAIPYWQEAGQQAVQRSANEEAISHLTKGLEVLKTLPDTPWRAQQELSLLITLGAPLSVARGFGAAEVERVYGQALELCRRSGETTQLFPALWGLHEFYVLRGSLQTGYEISKDLLQLAQSLDDPSLLLEARHALWGALVALGNYVEARQQAELGITSYDPVHHHSLTFLYGGHDPGVCCRSGMVFTLWALGYPDQALQQSMTTFALTQKLGHLVSMAQAFFHRTILHLRRSEGQQAQTHAEAMLKLSTEQQFPEWSALAHLLHGGAFVLQGQLERGAEKIRLGLSAADDTGSRLFRSYYLALLAEAEGKGGRVKEGFDALSEALLLVDSAGERFWEAELYRLKGKLTLQQGSQKSKGKRQKSKIETKPQAEAEACFLKAIEIAQKQQAKSLELRAAMSLARLWQSQGKHHAARNMLSDIYGWFTEGFDTKDLQEAQALLEELSF
jgi:predicted ATPase